jgi:DNA-binding XRE family transcriptional regulator
MITCRLNVIFAERKIKKGEFADKLGVSRGTLSVWCNDKGIPTLEMAYRVAEELDLNVMEIWIRNKEV